GRRAENGTASSNLVKLGANGRVVGVIGRAPFRHLPPAAFSEIGASLYMLPLATRRGRPYPGRIRQLQCDDPWVAPGVAIHSRPAGRPHGAFFQKTLDVRLNAVINSNSVK